VAGQEDCPRQPRQPSGTSRNAGSRSLKRFGSDILIEVCREEKYPDDKLPTNRPTRFRTGTRSGRLAVRVTEATESENTPT
jgi:hypothetical protein